MWTKRADRTREASQMENVRAAIEMYTKSLMLAANNPDALYGRALAYLTIGDYDKAESDLLKYVSRMPTNPSVYAALARTYFMKNQYDLTHNYAQKSIFGRGDAVAKCI
jgi:predicted Zn-dependent protease